MGCLGGENRIGDDHVGFRKTSRARTCTDLLCLVLFFFFWALLIFVASFAFVVGNPLRLVYGSDSFGNICGRRNDPFDNLPFSGLDLRSKPFVFYLNTKEISKSLKICVKQCPNETINHTGDLFLFYQRTNASLCRYDIDMSDGENYGYGSSPSLSGSRGSDSAITIQKRVGEDANACPKFPVHAS